MIEAGDNYINVDLWEIPQFYFIKIIFIIDNLLIIKRKHFFLWAFKIYWHLATV